MSAASILLIILQVLTHMLCVPEFPGVEIKLFCNFLPLLYLFSKHRCFICSMTVSQCLLQKFSKVADNAIKLQLHPSPLWKPWINFIRPYQFENVS